MTNQLTITDLNYAGEATGFMLTPAVIDIDTIKKGCISWLDDVRKAISLPTLDITNVMQARMAQPVPGATSITVGRRYLIPQLYMSYVQFDPLDFLGHWFSREMGPDLIDAPLPAEAQAYLMFQLGLRINEFNENQIWRGRIGYQTANGALSPASVNCAAGDSAFQYFDGLINKLLNDASTLSISGTTITSGNIISILQTVYTTIPITIYNRIKEVRFLMSPDTHRLYNLALANLTYKDTFNTDASKQQFLGYEVVSLAGLPDNTIIAGLAVDTNEGAFWLAVNSKDNSNQLKLDKVNSASEFYYVKMLMKADVNFSFAFQTVLYTNILPSTLYTPVS